MIKAIAPLTFIVLIMSISFLDVRDMPYYVQAVPGGQADDAADAGDAVRDLSAAIDDIAACRAGRSSEDGGAAACGDHFRQDAYAHLAGGAAVSCVERDRANRDRIIRFLLQPRNTGCTLAEMAEALSMNAGTLDYYLAGFEHEYAAKSGSAGGYSPHVKTLLFTAGGREHRFVRVQEGKYTRIWPGELRDKPRMRILITHLRDPIRSQIIRSILCQPGITNILLSQAFGRNKSTMHRYLKQFHDDAIIRVEQDGRSKRCFVRDDARPAIDSLRSLLGNSG